MFDPKNPTRPSYVAYSKTRKNSKFPNNSNNLVQRSIFATLNWFAFEYNTNNSIVDINSHPLAISMNDTTRYIQNEKLNNDKNGVAAIHIGELTIRWRKYQICKEKGIPYRPGPYMMVFENYREYWKRGNFIKSTWDNVTCEWEPPFGMRNGVKIVSLGADDGSITWEPYDMRTYLGRNPNINENRPTAKYLRRLMREYQITVGQLIELLNTTSKPVSLLTNDFFQSESDKFRFMDIIHKAKK